MNSGWKFGGQATAAAKNGDMGGAMGGRLRSRMASGMYRLTDKGIALEITAKGTKYYLKMVI